MSSAIRTSPVTPVKRPRTLVTMKCRPTKASSACPGSMSQMPGCGEELSLEGAGGDGSDGVMVMSSFRIVKSVCARTYLPRRSRPVNVLRYTDGQAAEVTPRQRATRANALARVRVSAAVRCAR